jgi:crossover junction endodeoxyribonuclease RusA
MIQFTIHDNPPSVNGFWGHCARGKYITAKGRTWREHIRSYTEELIKDGVIAPFNENARLSVKYEFHFKGKRKRDTGNYEKPLTDTFEGLLFENDECIDHIELDRYYNAEFDHTDILIFEIAAV